MKMLTVATIALSALAGSLPQIPATASPPEPGPRGRLCSYYALSDPSPGASDDAMTGEVNAGPMIADPGGTLYCTIRVNNNSHVGDRVGAVVSCPADWNGVIACATTVNYTSGVDDQDYMCTSYDKPNGGGTLYWHPTDDQGTIDPMDDEPGHWTGNQYKPCSPPQWTWPTVMLFDLIDSLTCSVLASFAGPGRRHFIDEEGDVFVDQDDDYWRVERGYDEDWETELIWDCPRYTFDDGNPDLNDGGDGVVDYLGAP